jgi:hypothetical protein
MPPWVLRGFGMAVLHAAAATALAKLAIYTPTDLTTIKIAMVAMLVGIAALWGALDGWLRRRDRGRGWFIGALIAGVVSGILYVIARSIYVDESGVRELWPALTGGAAFTALLVLVPAGVGLFVGGRMKSPKDDDLAGGDRDDGREERRAPRRDTRTTRTEQQPRQRQRPDQQRRQRPRGEPVG